MSGKGDTPRPVDGDTYRREHDRIFRVVAHSHVPNTTDDLREMERRLAADEEATLRATWFVPADLTDAQCQQIRQWRCVDNFSWRGVAHAAHEAFGGKWQPTWNQVAGLDLCEAAAKRLGEDHWGEPWN